MRQGGCELYFWPRVHVSRLFEACGGAYWSRFVAEHGLCKHSGRLAETPYPLPCSFAAGGQ